MLFHYFAWDLHGVLHNQTLVTANLKSTKKEKEKNKLYQKYKCNLSAISIKNSRNI